MSLPILIYGAVVLSSPVVKKKIISGRNKNQKKVIVVQQGSVEPTKDVSNTGPDAPQVLKFRRDDMESYNVLLSAALPGGKAKKLLGRLKGTSTGYVGPSKSTKINLENGGLEQPALVDTSGYLIKQVCCGSYHSALINRKCA